MTARCTQGQVTELTRWYFFMCDLDGHDLPLMSRYYPEAGLGRKWVNWCDWAMMYRPGASIGHGMSGDRPSVLARRDHFVTFSDIF